MTAAETHVSITFLDGEGAVVVRFTNAESSTDSECRVPAEPGGNSFVWDLRYPGPLELSDDVVTAGVLTGPIVAPGEYTVRLDVDEHTQEASFQVLMDPRVHAEDAALQGQFELSRQIRDKISEAHAGVLKLRRIRHQLDEWAKTARTDAGAALLAGAAGLISEKLASLEWPPVQPKARTPQDRNYMAAGLNAKLAELYAVVAAADAAPTQQSYELFEDLSARVGKALSAIQDEVETDVAAFNALVDGSGLGAVVISR